MAKKHLGWLRAAVLGANDGIVSTASLVFGVAAANPVRANVLVAGVAGLIAGAMSMAAGEYVSVSSQADAERVHLARERKILAYDEAKEFDALVSFYIARDLDPVLARQVAHKMMAYAALETPAHDTPDMADALRARPIQAAMASAASFSLGAVMPLIAVFLAPTSILVPSVSTISIVVLALLGLLAARVGEAPILKAVARVTFWGVLAMIITAGVGALFGTVV